MTSELPRIVSPEEIEKLVAKLADLPADEQEAGLWNIANKLGAKTALQAFELLEQRKAIAAPLAPAAPKPEPEVSALRRRLNLPEGVAEKLQADAARAKAILSKAATPAVEPARAVPVAPAKLSPSPSLRPAPTPPPGATALERLTYPAGGLGHATQYVHDTAALPDRWLSLATALSACAKALDRKVLGPSGNSVVLWVLLLAETGAGKQHGMNCIRMLLRAMGVEKSYSQSGIASVQAVEQVLEGTTNTDPNPNPLVVIDEVGAWLKRISTKGQTGNVAEIPSILQSLWGWSPEMEWFGTAKVGKEMKPVHGPAFALFGASTEGKFIRAITKEEVSNGFVNRMLLFNIGRGARERIEPKYSWLTIPDWLAAALKSAAGDPAPPDKMKLMLPGGAVLRDFRRIGWGSGTKELWLAFEKEIRGMPSVDDRELWIRAPEYALRLTTVVAVFRGSAIVEIEDWNWGLAVVKYSMRQLVNALREGMSEDLDQVDLVETVRKEFIKKTKLTQGAIRKLCERKTRDHRKIDQVIDHLVKCGDIVEFAWTGAGQPTRRWQWQKRRSEG